MKERFKTLLKDRIVKNSILVSAILLVLICLYTLIAYPLLPPLIPIYNQLPWGVDRLDMKNSIFIPLSLSLVFMIVNTFFSQAVYEKMPLVVRMLSITTLFIHITLTIFILRITLLVI